MFSQILRSSKESSSLKNLRFHIIANDKFNCNPFLTQVSEAQPFQQHNQRSEQVQEEWSLQWHHPGQ